MASEKGMYWIAVGVVALALMNGPASRHWLNRFEDRAVAFAGQASAHAAAVLNLAEMNLGRQPDHCARTQVMFARIQTRLADTEVAIARRQAACARIQAERARIASMQQVQQF
jgi:hypothetical protein